MDEEKRAFNRVQLDSVTYLRYNSQCYPVELKDISLQGAGVTVENEIPLGKGTQCNLEINPTGCGVVLNLDALTMYHDFKDLGFMFCENDPDKVQDLYQVFESEFSDQDLF